MHFLTFLIVQSCISCIHGFPKNTELDVAGCKRILAGKAMRAHVEVVFVSRPQISGSPNQEFVLDSQSVVYEAESGKLADREEMQQACL